MCGAQWPESSIFSLFMNVSSLFSGMICYFRFRQVQHFQMRCSNISQIWKLNVLGLLLGVASAIGLIIVANFQEARAPWPQVRDYDLFHKKFRSYTLFSFFGFQAVVFGQPFFTNIQIHSILISILSLFRPRDWRTCNFYKWNFVRCSSSVVDQTHAPRNCRNGSILDQVINRNIRRDVLCDRRHVWIACSCWQAK